MLVEADVLRKALFCLNHTLLYTVDLKNNEIIEKDISVKVYDNTYCYLIRAQYKNNQLFLS